MNSTGGGAEAGAVLPRWAEAITGCTWERQDDGVWCAVISGDATGQFDLGPVPRGERMCVRAAGEIELHRSRDLGRITVELVAGNAVRVGGAIDLLLVSLHGGGVTVVDDGPIVHMAIGYWRIDRDSTPVPVVLDTVAHGAGSLAFPSSFEGSSR